MKKKLFQRRRHEGEEMSLQITSMAVFGGSNVSHSG